MLANLYFYRKHGRVRRYKPFHATFNDPIVASFVSNPRGRSVTTLFVPCRPFSSCKSSFCHSLRPLSTIKLELIEVGHLNLMAFLQGIDEPLL
jgi:hypothetical protein